jgi:hypothetical protein
MFMKFTNAIFLALWLSSAGLGQNFKSGSPGVDQASVVMTFPYPGFKGSVDFWSTVRIPKANGKAKITRLSATTSIDAYVDDLPPASSFGAEFNTYVLWLISPEGKVENAGEFVLHGDKSELHATTTWDSFGMVVSAESNCHAKAPTEFVVLVNAFSVDGIVEPGQLVLIPYAGLAEAEEN